MAGITFSTFENYVASQGVANDNKLVRIEKEEGGESWLSNKNAETDRIRSSLCQSRSEDQQRINNEIRNAFMKAVLNECGVSDASKLPPRVRDALKLRDYQGYFTFNSSLRADRDNSTLGRPLSLRRIRAVVQEVVALRETGNALSAFARETDLPLDLGKAFEGQRRLDAFAVFNLAGMVPNNGSQAKAFDDPLLTYAMVGKLPGLLDRLAQRKSGTPVTKSLVWRGLGLGNPPANLEAMSSDEFRTALGRVLNDKVEADLETLSPDLLKTPLRDQELLYTLRLGLKYDVALELLQRNRPVCLSDYVAKPYLYHPSHAGPVGPAQLLANSKTQLATDLRRATDTVIYLEGKPLFDSAADKGKVRGAKAYGFFDQMLTRVDEKVIAKRGTPLSDQEKGTLLYAISQSGQFHLTWLDRSGFGSNDNRTFNILVDDQGKVRLQMKPLHRLASIRNYTFEATLENNGVFVLDKCELSPRDTRFKQATESLSTAGRTLKCEGFDLGTAFREQRRLDAAEVLSFFTLEPNADLEQGTIGPNLAGHILVSKLPDVLDRLAVQPPGTKVTRTFIWQSLGLGEVPRGLNRMSRDDFSHRVASRLVEIAKDDSRSFQRELRTVRARPLLDLDVVLSRGLKYDAAVALFTSRAPVESADFVAPPAIVGLSHPNSGGQRLTDAQRLVQLKHDFDRDIAAMKGTQIYFGETRLFPADPNDAEEAKYAGMSNSDKLLAKFSEEVKKSLGETPIDKIKIAFLNCFRKDVSTYLTRMDKDMETASNRKFTFSVDDNGLIKVELTPLDPAKSVRDYRIEMTFRESGASVAENFWLGQLTEDAHGAEETLSNAGKVLAPEAFDLTKVFTGKKRVDAAAVLSLIDLRPQFEKSPIGYALIGLLPGILDKLAKRQPPCSPITRTMLWQTMGIGNPPPDLEDLPRDQFSQTLAGRIQNRIMADIRKIPQRRIGPGGGRSDPFNVLYTALNAGFKYESALDILTSTEREVRMSDFVYPPVSGNKIDNPSAPKVLLETCTGTFARDIPRMNNCKCTFEGNLLFDMEVKGKGRQLKGEDEGTCRPFVDFMLSKINVIALQKRGRALSDREMAGLLGCISQQGGHVLNSLDMEVFYANTCNREITLSFDEKDRIKVGIKPLHPERYARDYEIEATVHEDGICVIDNLFVSKRLRPLPGADQVAQNGRGGRRA